MQKSFARLIGVVVVVVVGFVGALGGLFVTACGGPGGGPAGSVFELPRGAPLSEYYALPFPNDLRVKDDGTLDLDQLPRDNAILTQYFALFSAQFSGFSTTGGSYFRFDAAIDLHSLPKDPQASAKDNASVYLVDVDPASAHKGERVPLKLRFQPLSQTTIGENWLAVLPYPGFVLRPLTRYAVVLTRRLHATDGSSVKRSLDFEALMDPLPSTDAAVTHAREVYAPLLDWLDEPGGDERSDVVAATIFTTSDPVSLMPKMREVVRSEPVPELYDTMQELTNDTLTFYSATYDGPIFQDGEVPYMQAGGEIHTDMTTGLPIVQRHDPIRIGISVPAGPVPAGGWPTIIYAHGTGGDYKSFLGEGLAFKYASKGFAMVGITQNMNGERIPNNISADQAFYNFTNPVAGRDNSRQAAADQFAIVYMLETLVVAQTDPAVRSHTFDTSKLYYFGHSQGGITGPLFIPFEPTIRANILSGTGGLLYWALLQKKEPVDIGGLLESLIRDNPLDEFDPVLALIQMYIEPADPINYARLIALEPPPGGTAKDVFQSEGFVDHYTPIPNIEAFSIALGGSLCEPVLQPVEGMDVAGRPTLSLPVKGNANGRTVTLSQYTAEAGSDGHFVVFEVPAAQKQSGRFLSSALTDGIATLSAP